MLLNYPRSLEWTLFFPVFGLKFFLNRINNEVVSGLKYAHKVTRKSIPLGSDSHMLGSYGPKKDSQTAMTPWEEVCFQIFNFCFA